MTPESSRNNVRLCACVCLSVCVLRSWMNRERAPIYKIQKRKRKEKKILIVLQYFSESVECTCVCLNGDCVCVCCIVLEYGYKIEYSWFACLCIVTMLAKVAECNFCRIIEFQRKTYKKKTKTSSGLQKMCSKQISQMPKSIHAARIQLARLGDVGRVFTRSILCVYAENSAIIAACSTLFDRKLHITDTECAIQFIYKHMHTLTHWQTRTRFSPRRGFFRLYLLYINIAQSIYCSHNVIFSN